MNLHKIQKQQQGFTLIELLVVVIILGILASIGLPSLFQQVAKGREAEAKTILSSIAQSQEGYFVENGTFAPSTSALEINFDDTKYYSFTEPDLISSTVVRTKANPQGIFINKIRKYSMGVYHIAPGVFHIILCQSLTPQDDANAPTTLSGSCIDGKELK